MKITNLTSKCVSKPSKVFRKCIKIIESLDLLTRPLVARFDQDRSNRINYRTRDLTLLPKVLYDRLMVIALGIAGACELTKISREMK